MGNTSIFVNAVVAMVLGIVIGVVGLVALRDAVEGPSACEVAYGAVDPDGTPCP